MNKCNNCNSFALNIAPESGFCDVCYWKNKYEKRGALIQFVIDDLNIRRTDSRGVRIDLSLWRRLNNEVKK